MWTVSFQNAPQRGGVTATLGIDADITQLSYSTDIAGGFNGAKIGMMDRARPRYGYLPQGYEIVGQGHVEIRDGANGPTVYAGRITKRSRVGQSGQVGDVFGVECQGYGVIALGDNYYTSASATSTTSGQVLQSVVQVAAPLLKPAIGTPLWQDPGVTSTRVAYSGQQVSQIVDQISKAGSSVLNCLFDFTVWENFAAYFRPRIPPATPDYEIPIDDGTITGWDEDYTLACSNVVARYTPTGGSATLTNPTTFAQQAFVANYGFTRTTLLDVGTCDSNQAQAVANAYQTLNAGPQISVQVTLANGQEMLRPGGGSKPASQVRAGEWVRVGDDGVAGNPGQMIIVHTEYDANAQKLVATLGFQPRGLWPNYARLLQTMGAYGRQINLNSGARIAAGAAG